MEVKTKSPRETQKVAEKLTKSIGPGEVIALFGELGSGKTVFVQGLAKGLGIKRQIVSPTYVFMRMYPFTKGKQNLTFYHLDLYRGENQNDLVNLGLDEIFSPESVVVLEWAERLGKSLPKKRKEIRIESVNEKERKIKIREFK